MAQPYLIMHGRPALKASCRSAIAVLAQNEKSGERGGPPGS
jgi:hypothetical protein